MRLDQGSHFIHVLPVPKLKHSLEFKKSTSGRFFTAVMDSFSGSFPLEFNSFYLDMSSEEDNEVVPATATGTLIEEEVPQQLEETAVSPATAALKDAESKQRDPPKTVQQRLTQRLVLPLMRVSLRTLSVSCRL